MKVALCLLFCCIAGASGDRASGLGFPGLRRKHREEQDQAAAKAAEEAEAATPAAPTSSGISDAANIVVPAAGSPGADGFPALPEVNAMLGSASDTLRSINSQAAILESRVVQAQRDNEARISQQKTVYEERLKEQENQSRVVIGGNSKISEEINKLKEDNTALKKQTKSLKDGNKLRRAELKVLLTKLGIAKDFLTSSLKSTDDSKAEELAVLDIQHSPSSEISRHVDQDASQTNTSANVTSESTDKDEELDEEESNASHDKDDEDTSADTEGEDSAEAFLAVERRVHRKKRGMPSTEAIPESIHPNADARDLLTVLSKGVDDLSKEAKTSETKLKTMFIEAFKAGHTRHTALLAQKQALESSHKQLQTLQTELRGAVAHLESTRKQLERRLKGIGEFFKRLGHLASAPVAEVPRIIKALPSSVSFTQS